jgi:predicted enzyme related to lactoylglutathione lyase
MHLDVNASKPYGHTDQGWRQVEDHVRILTTAGATVVREVNEVTGQCIVMRDPEGNEFCVQ